MDREELRQKMVDGIDGALRLPAFILHQESRIMLLAVKGVVAVDTPASDAFLDAVLVTMPKGEI